MFDQFTDLARVPSFVVYTNPLLEYFGLLVGSAQ